MSDFFILFGQLCPYCRSKPQFVDSKVIYGRSYGMIYLCKPCDAYVGVHKGTTKPLGRLANKELREWKKSAHASFDPIWKNEHMKRNQAYKWLAGKMSKQKDFCHIGMFDIKECKQVISICEEYYKEK